MSVNWIESLHIFLCAQGQQQAQLAQECFLRCLRGEEASKLALNYVRGRGEEREGE